MQLPPGVEKKHVLSLPAISSAQIYAEQMRSSEVNFNVVDIINNEVISAGQYNGNPVLVHCRVNIGGNLEFTLKSNDPSLLEVLANSTLPQGLCKRG
jgi:hypothetical protein